MWRSGVVVGVALFVSYAYFYQAGGWNQNSRFALVRAIIERHTIQIDAYQAHTGDRALWNGHYYSDKSPGVSLLAVLPVAAAREISRLAGVDPESLPGIVWTSYAASVATSALFTVIAALGVFWLSLRWGASRGAALFATTAYGLASPAWAYGTVFIGHGVTAGCLMLAFAATVALPDAGGSQKRLSWAIGLLCGVAVLSEYPAAVPVMLIVILALATVYTSDRQKTVPLMTRVLIGGAVMAAVLFAYNYLAFGSPVRFGYGSEDNAEGLAMQQGMFGITYPTLHVIYEVLLGKYRGLLPLAPVMALAPVGLVWLARRQALRRQIAVAAAIAAGYFLLNVSYKYWEGGWFYAPRHLTPGLPFLALGLAPLWDRWRGVGRILLAACWIWGASMTLIAVSTTPQPPSNIASPVTELMWPAFREGDLSLNHQTFVDFGADPDLLRHHPELHASWNLGERMHLRGLPSLLPLAAVWGAAALILL